ncbi:ABC transporter permease [Corynebacterium sp. 335C]
MRGGALARVGVRSVRAHVGRLVLTIVSVVLGTAFIAGSLLFTATLDRAFQGVLSTAYDGVDVVVEAPADASAPLTIAAAESLGGVDGVASVNLSAVPSGIVITDPSGAPVQTPGPPAQAMPWYGDTAVGGAPEIVAGSAPSGPGHVAVNRAAAEHAGISPGDRVTVVTPASRADVVVDGLYAADVDSASAVGVYLDRADWLAWYTDGEHVTAAHVDVADGADPAAVADAIRAAQPGLDVSLGADRAAQLTESVSEGLSFLNYFLAAFGLIGLGVGAFIISNTFSMIVARRMREFALLRALGASRGQLTASVAAEAAIVGLIGSALGVAAGFGLVKLLFLGMEAADLGLPDSGIAVTPGAVAVPVVAGTVITVLAAWAPARRAGSTPPVAAMRGGDATGAAGLLVRTIAGVVLAALGVALTAAGILMEDADTGPRASLAGTGAALVVAGFWLLSPALSIPVVGTAGAVLGAPFRATGRIAATNARRTPRRTAATAFALTLGLMLVSTLGMFGASMKSAVSDWVETDLRADLVLSPAGLGGPGQDIPPGARDDVRAVPGVADYAEEKLLFGALGTQDAPPPPPTRGGHDPSLLLGVFDGDLARWQAVDVLEGSANLADPAAGVVLTAARAAELGAHAGDPVLVATQAGVVPVTVTGVIAEDPQFAARVSANALEAAQVDMNPLPTTAAYLALDPAADADEVRAGVEDAVAPYLIVQVQDREEYANAMAGAFDMLLNILYGLLALAVVIAVLGIVNTLALSIVERRQEIGMLRAVGMTRRQVRRMIRLEAVQIALYGAVTGTLLGMAFGWAFLTTLAGEGIDRIVVPWGQIAVMLVASALVGVLAAVWPGHRAAKTPPLAAVAEE